MVNFAEPIKPTVISEFEINRDVDSAAPKVKLVLEAWCGIVGLRCRQIFRRAEQKLVQQPLTEMLKKLERENKQEASKFILNAASHSENYFYANKHLQDCLFPVYQHARPIIQGNYFHRHESFVDLIDQVKERWEANFVSVICGRCDVDKADVSETDKLKKIWKEICRCFITHLVMVFVQELEDSEENIKLAIRVALKSVKTPKLLDD